MSKPRVPNSKGATARETGPGTASEKEPVNPETSAKKDKDLKTEEVIDMEEKGKDSVPSDSTAQRGKTPIKKSNDQKKVDHSGG